MVVHGDFRKLLKMKPVHYITVIILLAIASLFAWNSHLPIRVFRAAGEVELGGTRIYADTITPTTGNGFSIDISAAGFSTIPRVQVLPMRNTATVTSVPNVAVKSISTTTIVVNITEGNPNTVNILGSIVTLGAPTQFVATPSTILLNVQAVGN